MKDYGLKIKPSSRIGFINLLIQMLIDCNVTCSRLNVDNKHMRFFIQDNKLETFFEDYLKENTLMYPKRESTVREETEKLLSVFQQIAKADYENKAQKKAAPKTTKSNEAANTKLNNSSQTIKTNDYEA